MHCCQSLYRMMIAFSLPLQAFVLLALRLYWGWLFFQSGFGKLANIEGVSAFFSTLNIPFPWLNAYLAASIECVGGLCLVVGLAARLVAIPLIVTMLVAYATAHSESVQHIFENPQAFVMQTPFNFLLTALIVLAFGPGIFSLDALIKRQFLRNETN